MDLDPGTGTSYFGGTIDAYNTIKVLYGSLTIDAPVIIRAPKSLVDTKDYVEVHWVGSLYPTTGDPLSGSDWSVFQVNVAEKTLDGKRPNYAKAVEFNGLKLTGGKAGSGGGISALGYHTLAINTCLITENKTFRIPGNEQNEKFTSGAGVFAGGKFFELEDRSIVTYGPKVVVSKSKIEGNITAANDTSEYPATDRGAGLFLGSGSSLIMSGSTVFGNTADNDGAGIYFEGGMFFENPDSEGKLPLFVAELKIYSSTIGKNTIVSEIGKGSGGGLVIAGPTGAFISDTTFGGIDPATQLPAGNIAKQNGGAVHITGLGVPFSEQDPTPYAPRIGMVNFVSCTFEGNQAGQQVGTKIADFGSGGALAADGIVNESFIVNCTFSGNATEIGKGGAISVLPRVLYYNFRIWFDVAHDARSMKLNPDIVHTEDPPGNFVRNGNSSIEIHNTTIADNFSGGAVQFDDVLMKNVTFGARGGGIAVHLNDSYGLDGKVKINSTIVAENTVQALTPTGFGPDIWCADDTVSMAAGLIQLAGFYNLVGVGGDPSLGGSGQFKLHTSVTSGTKATPTLPLLDDLDDYGGRTKTYRLQNESPAVDLGDNPLMLMFDQRGVPDCREVEFRIDQQFDPRADIGSYEIQTRLPTVLSVKANNQPQQSMINSLTITFSEIVTLPNPPSTAFLLERVVDTLPVGNVGLNVVQYGAFVTLTFTAGGTVPIDPAGSLIDGVYKLTVIGTHVNGGTGLLDGNCDGIGGDSFVMTGSQANDLFRLFGDGDGNGKVDNFDFALFRACFGITNFGPGYNMAFDYDGNGSINSVDFAHFRARFGLNLF